MFPIPLRSNDELLAHFSVCLRTGHLMMDPSCYHYCLLPIPLERSSYSLFTFRSTNIYWRETFFWCVRLYSHMCWQVDYKSTTSPLESTRVCSKKKYIIKIAFINLACLVRILVVHCCCCCCWCVHVCVHVGGRNILSSWVSNLEQGRIILYLSTTSRSLPHWK